MKENSEFNEYFVTFQKKIFFIYLKNRCLFTAAVSFPPNAVSKPF